MVMVRGETAAIHVLYNRCPHRGMQVCGNRKGNAGNAFICSYHAWSFHFDGTCASIPLPQRLRGHAHDPSNPDCNMKRAPRVDSYRGFVFASLAADGPSLAEFLGRPRSRSTTCATARRRARSRWCRSATA